MAQDFSLRYPSSMAGTSAPRRDNAAAYRYTEARSSDLTELLAELLQETVDFRPNYDSRTRESVVLPARIPHPGQRGDGIAVGMATNIRPNLGEVLRRARR
jgi:DNA gyrase/topoisomerase IV subunit A